MKAISMAVLDATVLLGLSMYLLCTLASRLVPTQTDLAVFLQQSTVVNAAASALVLVGFTTRRRRSRAKA